MQTWGKSGRRKTVAVSARPPSQFIKYARANGLLKPGLALRPRPEDLSLDGVETSATADADVDSADVDLNDEMDDDEKLPWFEATNDERDGNVVNTNAA